MWQRFPRHFWRACGHCLRLGSVSVHHLVENTCAPAETWVPFRHHVFLVALGAAKLSRICGRKSASVACADRTEEFVSRVIVSPGSSADCCLFVCAGRADAREVRSARKQATFLLRPLEGFSLRAAVALRHVDPPLLPRGRARCCQSNASTCFQAKFRAEDLALSGSMCASAEWQR